MIYFCIIFKYNRKLWLNKFKTPALKPESAYTPELRQDKKGLTKFNR